MSSPASNPLRLDFILNSSRPSSPPAVGRDEPFPLSVEPSRTLGPIRPATHHDVMTGSPRVAEWSVPRRHSDYPRPYSHHPHSRAAPYPAPVHLSASQSQVIDNHAYTSIHPSIIDGNPCGREGISRATKACNACRDSKVRCNHGPGFEACERCAKAGRKCVWSTTQRKRGPAPGTLNPNRPTTAARRNRRSNASASGSVSTVTPSPPMPYRSLAPHSDAERERERVGTIRTTPPFTVPELGLALHRASVESAASARLLTPEHDLSRRSSNGGFGGRPTLPPPSLRPEGSSPAHRPSLHHQQQDRRSSYQGWQPPVKRAEPVPAPARTYFPADYSVRHTYTETDMEIESAGQKPRQMLPSISALLDRPPPPYSPPHREPPASPRHRPPPVIVTDRRSSLFGSDGRSMPPSISSAPPAGRRSFWNADPLQPTSRPAFYA